MFVIVVGCGRVGSELAFRLFQAGHQVAVIDEVGTSFENLHPDYRGRTIEGFVAEMDTAHITAAVMVARSVPGVRVTNDALHAAAQHDPARLIPIASVDPVELGRDAAVAAALTDPAYERRRTGQHEPGPTSTRSRTDRAARAPHR